MLQENEEEKEALKSALRIFKSRTKGKFDINDVLKKNLEMYSEDDALDQDVNATVGREEPKKDKSNLLSFSVNGRRLVVYKTDRKYGEHVTGADLIYHAVEDKKYLLIQHKVVENENRRITLDKQLESQFERLFGWCGKSHVNMGTFRFECGKQFIDNMTSDQSAECLKRIRLSGYCPAYLKICLKNKNRNLDASHFSSGVIIPACIAYVMLKNKGFIKANLLDKMLRHSELESLFANCLIGRDDENLAFNIGRQDEEIKFIAKETTDDSKLEASRAEIKK